MTILFVAVIVGVLMILAGAYYGIQDHNHAWIILIIVGTLIALLFANLDGRDRARQEFMNELSKDVDLRKVPVKGDVRFRFEGHIVFLEGKLKKISRIEKTTVLDPFPVVPAVR